MTTTLAANPGMDASEIQSGFDDVFDWAVVFHGFTDYMRDYEFFIYATADPGTGLRAEHFDISSRTASGLR